MEQGGKCVGREVKKRRGPCSSSPCLGGGSCESHDGTFTCYCTEGRTGQFCEKAVDKADIQTAGFTGQSFVMIKNPAMTGPRSSVVMRFKPLKEDGVIMFSTSDNDQSVRNISLSLRSGFVEFRYKEPSGHLTLLSSSRIVPGYWHSLSLHTYHGDAMLQLDQEDPVLGTFGRGKISGLGPRVNIGGKTPESADGYHGCVSHLRLGQHSVSFNSPRGSLLLESEGLTSCETYEPKG